MKLRRWSTFLCRTALILVAIWACWRVGCAFKAVELAAQRTATAMEQTTQYRAAYQWDPGPPPR